jgi:hypothetical protein
LKKSTPSSGAAGENAEIVAEESGEFIHESGNAGGVSRFEPDR